MKDYIEALREIKKENKDFKITLSRKEVLELVNEFDRLNNIINELEKYLIEFTTDSKVIINGIEITNKNEWDRVLKHLEEYYKNFNKISSLLNYEQDKRIKLENIIKEVREYLRQKSMIVHIERTNDFVLEVYLKEKEYKELLEILDKENK